MNTDKHTVVVCSYDRHHIEWERTLTAANRSAAMRRAWAVVRDCGASRGECLVERLVEGGATTISIGRGR